VGFNEVLNWCIGIGAGLLCAIPIGLLIAYLIKHFFYSDDNQEEVEAISPDTIIIIADK